jgi:hypothetical protein
MASIKDSILSIKTKLQTLTDLQFVAIWNNQLAEDLEGQIYSFPKPAAFVEAITPNPWMPLGLGYSQSDVIFAIHIVHEEYDAGNGNYEQDTNVYDLKTKVNQLLTYFVPTQGGRLMKISEQQDYNHNNLYHYIIQYTCGVIDNDADTTRNDITKAPPTAITIPVTITTVI